MSIESELLRIEQAKADLKTAIESKGVPIAENALIDSYPQAVSQIENSNYYNEFWDAYQALGVRSHYEYAFYQSGWNEETFLPKYSMKNIEGADYMFAYSAVEIDLPAFCEEHNIEFSFSSDSMVGGVTCAFYWSCFTRLGEIDCSNIYIRTRWTNLFRSASSLKTIDKLILPTRTAVTFDNCFNNCSALENIVMEGVIAGSVQMQWSPLSTASMKSIISCITDYSGTENAFAYTLSFNEQCWANLDAEGNTSPHGNTWRTYCNDLGWNA